MKRLINIARLGRNANAFLNLVKKNANHIQSYQSTRPLNFLVFHVRRKVVGGCFVKVFCFYAVFLCNCRHCVHLPPQICIKCRDKILQKKIRKEALIQMIMINTLVYNVQVLDKRGCNFLCAACPWLNFTFWYVRHDNGNYQCVNKQ